jgi:glucose-1-phosphate cytidylyltransferase
MKYYAHFGHKEFILCLGYKADVIKKYFLNYDECLSNDFTLGLGEHRARQQRHSRLEDLICRYRHEHEHRRTPAGVRDYLGDDEYFLAITATT